MKFQSISLNKKPRVSWVVILLAVVIGFGGVGYLTYRYVIPSSSRWTQYRAYQQNTGFMEDVMLRPGMRCGDAPFAFPTTGVIFGLWNQSYRPGHIHAGLDIFTDETPGVTPIYAAYPGYLTRQSDWLSTIIIRIPDDPLEPGRQIWTYYTHMANTEGTESFVSDEFPMGTREVYVEAGTFLGYQGTWSGTPGNPTGLHLHFSVVKDDGSGQFLNELEIKNTYDPTPYFNLPVNNSDNPNDFPVCQDTITFEDWDLVNNDEDSK